MKRPANHQVRTKQQPQGRNTPHTNQLGMPPIMGIGGMEPSLLAGWKPRYPEIPQHAKVAKHQMSKMTQASRLELRRTGSSWEGGCITWNVTFVEPEGILTRRSAPALGGDGG